MSIKHCLENHIEAEAQLFCGLDNQIYAKFRSEWGVEVVSVDEQRFAEWLTDYCISSSLRPDKLAIKSVLASLKAKECGPLRPICVRVGACSKGDVYLNLSGRTGQAVHISSNGWIVVDEPKVLFPTRTTQRPLPEPIKGGSVHALREMFGLSSCNEALIVSFCLACLKGCGSYPILLIVGPDGSGRTTLANYLRTLMDPSSVPLRNLPKNAGELGVTAASNHVLAYDDVQAISPWLETAFCRLSKGTTFSECRGGQEQIRSQGAKAIILSGSDEILLHRELVSRALVVRLDARTKFSSSINGFKLIPEVLGALLDIVSHGLNRWNDQKISDPLREFEFEKWMAACELPRWGLSDFDVAYETNVADGVDDLLELDPFLMALRDHVTKTKVFRGTCGALLNALNDLESGMRGHRWPKSPRAVSSRLRRDAKLLPELKMEFGIKEGRNRDRLMVIELKDADQALHVGSKATKDRREEVARAGRKGPPGVTKEREMSLFPEGS